MRLDSGFNVGLRGFILNGVVRGIFLVGAFQSMEGESGFGGGWEERVAQEWSVPTWRGIFMVVVQLLSPVRFFATPWTAAC